MKNDIGKKIVEQAKAETAAKVKVEKANKAKWYQREWKIKLSTLAIIIVSLAMGAYVGINVNTTISNHIDGQIKSQVDAQVQQLKASK